MAKKFRALQLVTLICKVFAWIVFVVGALLTLFVVIVGAIQGQQSPILATLPVLYLVTDLVSGLVAGVLILLISLLKFVFLYAAADYLELMLAIEHNTQQTAFYLRGENNLPLPPEMISWDTPPEPDEEE